MFEENKFKAEIIQGLPQDTTISLYRCGPMVRRLPPSIMMWQSGGCAGIWTLFSGASHLQTHGESGLVLVVPPPAGRM